MVMQGRKNDRPIGADIDRMNLSFAGCGFLGMYHIGVASAFKEHAPYIIVDRVVGTSAGSLAACGLICDVDMGGVTNFIIDIARRAVAGRGLGPAHPTFQPLKKVREMLMTFLPEDAYKRCSGRLFVSLTRVYDRKNVIISRYSSNEDLIQCLLCSCFIPWYCGVMAPSYRGYKYIDGGLTANNAILDEHTIRVSPFSGECDICPSDNADTMLVKEFAGTSIQFTLANLFRASSALYPMNSAGLEKLANQGFNDALRFLRMHNLLQCPHHLKDYVTERAQLYQDYYRRITLLGKEEAVESLKATNNNSKVPPADATSDCICTDCCPCHCPVQLALRLQSEVVDRKEGEEWLKAHGQMKEDDESSDSDDDWHVDERKILVNDCKDCEDYNTGVKTYKLPKAVARVLRAAVEQDKNSEYRIWKWFKQTRAGWYAGWMILPYLMAFELTTGYSLRLLKYLPYIGSDIISTKDAFLEFLNHLYTYVYNTTHFNIGTQPALTDVEPQPAPHRIPPLPNHNCEHFKKFFHIMHRLQGAASGQEEAVNEKKRPRSPGKSASPHTVVQMDNETKTKSSVAAIISESSSSRSSHQHRNATAAADSTVVQVEEGGEYVLPWRDNSSVIGQLRSELPPCKVL